MKKLRFLLLTLLILCIVSISGFSQTQMFSDIQKKVMSFSEEIAKSLPLNSSIGLNWSDAYIGKLFPSIPPHFGVGGAFGFTTMELTGMKELAGLFGYTIPIDIDRLILPAYTVEARAGGLFAPFDVGFKYGYLPSLGLWGIGNIDVNYLLVGGDIRYALIDGKKSLIKPNISIGVGLNYLRGGISGKVGQDQTINYGSGGDSITLKAPRVGLEWDTLFLDFKAQISKSFLIITPYAGIGAGYGWSSAGYSIESKVTGTNAAFANDLLTLFGIDASNTGISSIIEENAFSFRLFGGASINLVVFKIDLTGIWSIRDTNFGASLGFRFQI